MKSVAGEGRSGVLRERFFGESRRHGPVQGLRAMASAQTTALRTTCYEQNMNLYALGKLVLWAGVGTAILGLLLMAAGRGFFPHLPGDFSFRVGNARVFLPLATSLLLSLLLTVVLNLFFRR